MYRKGVVETRSIGGSRWGLSIRKRGKCVTKYKNVINEIDDLVEARRYRAAEARCSAVLVEYPESIELLRVRARLRRRSGDRAGAIDDANRIVALRPDDARSYLDRGHDLVLAGQLDAAVADFTAVLQRFPQHEDSALFYRAEALMRWGRLAEARADCLRLPDDFTYWFETLRTKAQMIADCDRAIETGRSPFADRPAPTQSPVDDAREDPWPIVDLSNLAEMSPDERIDAIVLSRAQPNWRKVAMIISLTARRAGRDDDSFADAVAARIVALVSAGRLEGQGDLSNWRGSEVRLARAKPDETPADR